MFVIKGTFFTQVHRRRRNRTAERADKCDRSGQSKDLGSPQPPPGPWTKGEPWSADSMYHDASIQHRSSLCGNTTGCTLYVYTVYFCTIGYRQVSIDAEWKQLYFAIHAAIHFCPPDDNLSLHIKQKSSVERRIRVSNEQRVRETIQFLFLLGVFLLFVSMFQCGIFEN